MRISDAVSGGYRESLVALRDRLAALIDDCDSGRDVAALSRQFVDVSQRLEDLGVESRKEGTPVDDIAKRRDYRRRARAESAGGS